MFVQQFRPESGIFTNTLGQGSAPTPLAESRASAAGITYPGTLHAWRWLYRHRHERGLADAFRRIGRRIVVDPEHYVKLVRQRTVS